MACVPCQIKAFLLKSKMILVTGANGFLGQALGIELKARQYALRGALRAGAKEGQVSVGDIGPDTDWLTALSGVNAVVHTAARVHLMHDIADDPLSQYRKVNVEGTLNLAQQAATANVERFVFISSIKVNGESTLPGEFITVEDQPRPEDPYGVSKWEAEVGLTRLANETGMEVVIIRPPLVYGPGVRANFLRLMHWINRGLPLPLGSIDNKRSLVALANLVDLIITCIEHPAAANQIFLAGDGQDVSTTELLRGIGKALDKPVRLFTCPICLLSVAAALLGKRDMLRRLTCSLQVDISRARSLLGWKPPLSLEEGLSLVAQDFTQ
jgi:nucleoside-diphosphate-sugar epimerase